jgi:hypothetical protein
MPKAKRPSMPTTVVVMMPPHEMPHTPTRAGSTSGSDRRSEFARTVAATA